MSQSCFTLLFTNMFADLNLRVCETALHTSCWFREHIFSAVWPNFHNNLVIFVTVTKYRHDKNWFWTHKSDAMLPCTCENQWWRLICTFGPTVYSIFFFCSESFHTLSSSRAWIVRYHLHESTLDKSSHHFTYLAKTEFFSPSYCNTAYSTSRPALCSPVSCYTEQKFLLARASTPLHKALSCRAAFSGSLLYGVRRPNQVAKIRKRWKVRVCFLQRTQHGSQWPA